MAKVLKDFRCKVTKRVYRAGDEYDGDRTEELQALGYVEVGENTTPESEEKLQEVDADQGAGNEPEDKLPETIDVENAVPKSEEESNLEAGEDLTVEPEEDGRETNKPSRGRNNSR